MAFTNRWTAPNGTPIVTATIRFPDGTRSVAAVDRQNQIGVGQGWSLVHASGVPGGVDTGRTAKYFDNMLAQGRVLYYFQKPGPMPNGKGNFAPGFWTHTLNGVKAQELAGWHWGMSKLAGTMSQNAQAVGVVGPAPGPSPSPSGTTVIRPTAAPVVVAKPRRWPWVVAALAAAGIVYVIAD